MGPRCAFWASCTVLAIALAPLTGCQSSKTHSASVTADSHEHYIARASQIEYPELEQPVPGDALLNTCPVSLITDLNSVNYRDLALQDAVHLALEHSKVMRNLGGTVLRAPEAVTTSFDPAIRETDPRFGVQAALSAFDTSFGASVFHQNNDRALNNQFFGGGTRLLQQEATVFQAQLAKQSAVGTEYYLRNITDYDKNNAPGNRFPGAWTSLLETEVRQPLLQGYGIDYWQTVGNSQTPGLYNGVLVARTNTDISQSEFEISVRDFLTDVENAYWDLYFAYRDLDAKIAARDSALELWRRIDTLKQLGRAGGEADKEAQAREQYYRFEEDVQNALNGKPEDGTQAFNGAAGGTFKGKGGVLRAERRLRYMIGLPINDCCLLRPSDEPLAAPVCFDWDSSLLESVEQRPELRRQKWVVKQKELELVAAKKLLLPELDAVGLYRWRGFGETLTNPSDGGAPQFDNAWGDLATGRFQEWELGVELDIPIGNRRAHAGVRNAEFHVARSRKLLQEQERLIVHDLSNAMTETIRAWEVLQTVRNRLKAAADQVNALMAAYEADQAPVNVLLEAQRRYSAAKSAYYLAVLEYNVAVRNVHFEKGTYLEYCSVHVSEGPWTDDAYEFAARMERRKSPREELPRWINEPNIISHGTTSDPNSRVIVSEPMAIPAPQPVHHELPGDYFEQTPAPIPLPEPDEEAEDKSQATAPMLTPLPNAPRAAELPRDLFAAPIE
ncbi:TolC family protein [Rubinisphaera margarita]|uniref:TolC family protein n=1 Tax=Rubinisphaera margarita TaxID=2909586 RepID=UPI001EE7E05A|nr:TolC family protein [Rubinisphaera margarita]MCG6157860.1 TolC family protein [Rubinisphaera margarita]